MSLEMPKDPDRVSFCCPECRGSRRIQQVKSPVDIAVRILSEELSASQTIEVEEVDCPNCDGKGSIMPKNGDRVPVFQEGRQVGTCTVPATVRTSMLVDQRPGDYTARAVDGGMIYEASWTLGPGDIERLVGFRWAV